MNVSSPTWQKKWGIRIGCVLGILVILTAARAIAQAPKPETLGVELFIRPDSEQAQLAETFLQDLAERRTGMSIRVVDVAEDKGGLARLLTLSKRFGRDEAKLPTIYMTDRLWVGFGSTTGASLTASLTVDAYVRPGCPHCRDAKLFLEEMNHRWPAVQVKYHDVIADRAALQKARALVRQHRAGAVSFPVISAAGRLHVGFMSPNTSGKRIEAPFRSPAPIIEDDRSSAASTRLEGNRDGWSVPVCVLEAGPRGAFWMAVSGVISADDAPQVALPDEASIPREARQESPIPEDADWPEEGALPTEGALPQDALLPETTSDGDAEPTTIRVELLGKERAFNVEEYGLPAFTLVIGLIDGFNPCAMWVLIFLLSILVTIRDRKKILAIAGVFVLVSGLAYFAFMAAWLSVFRFVGLMRPVQIALGSMALVIGIINVKDFFAFHQGVTLSIPKSARPKLYRRMQQIIKANYLGAAVLGAVVLAVIVNVIELLCTAGLPALYTQILSLHDLSPAANYAYLGLYIVAYMADDALMIAVAVVTLSNRRMQETEGRWLKLLSGSVILLLGIVMLLRPDWLMLT